MKHTAKQLLLLTTAIALMSGIVVQIYAQNTAAVSASQWQAGRIIDDSVFTNKDDMSVADIQNFLNSKVPVCDNWGTKTSELGGGTRAQYAASRGYSLPFTCLKDFYEVPKTTPSSTLPANNYGGKSVPPGAQSAAQLIANAAQKYNINPKVLLVKLATESPGPLTSDDWPLERQYLYAMGAHCPDSGPGGSANCDSNWAGFSLQMDESARLMRWYLDSMNQPWWQYKKPNQNNYILWNVQQSGCGGSNVYISTAATAALYTYTPYQPNQAALNNMYGSGDGCSAYGNRNFWRVYSDWFGSTLVDNPYISLSSSLIINDGQPFRAGQIVSAKFSVRNSHSASLNTGTIGIAGRDENGKNRDIAYTNISIPGNSTRDISWTFTASAGTINYWITGLVPERGWMSSYPTSEPNVARTQTVTVSPNPTLSSNLRLNTSTPRVGQPVTVNYDVKNYASSPVSFGATGLALRAPDGKNADVAYESPTIPAGGTYTYNKTFTFNQPGNYTAWVANHQSDLGWNTAIPTSDSQQILRSTTWNVLDNPAITTGITLSPASPRVGEVVTATYTVSNFYSYPVSIGTTGLAVRTPSGKNADVAYESPTIPAGGTYTYNKTFTFSEAGDNKLWIAGYQNNSGWNDTYPKSDPGAIRTATINVRPNPTITGSLTLNTSTPKVGQPVTVRYSIRNYASTPVSIGLSGLALRTPSGANADVSFEEVTIPANGTFTYSRSFTFNQAGTYKGWVASFRSPMGWSDTYPASDSPSITRAATWDVTP